MTTWIGRTSPSTAWGSYFSATNPWFLLMEDGFYLLQENGSYVILDEGPSQVTATPWAARQTTATTWTARTIPA